MLRYLNFLPLLYTLQTKHLQELENIGSRIDMQTHAGSSSTRP